MHKPLSKSLNQLRHMVLLILLTVLVLVITPESRAQEKGLFQQCIEKVGGFPINMMWANGIYYLESTRSSSIIEAVLGVEGEPVKWDSTIGPHYPDDIRSRRDETIALGLNDGTLVSFIINLQTENRLYGWLTFSTYRTSADYNPRPNPHVHCGFWSILKSDRELLRSQFREELEQAKAYEDWMR